MSDLIERLRRRAGLSPAALDALLTEAAGRHERDAAALDKLATDYLRLETQAQEALYEVAALRRKVADLSRTLADHAARLSEAERERDAALHPRPEPHARGGFTARLPWRPDGYPRGHRVWDVARPGDCFYHFDRLDDAEAALQGARDAAGTPTEPAGETSGGVALSPTGDADASQRGDSETRGASGDPVRVAADAIHERYMDYSRPFTGLLVSVGEGAGEVVVYCRRRPTAEEKRECADLAAGVPVRFTVTGDFEPIGGAP